MNEQSKQPESSAAAPLTQERPPEMTIERMIRDRYDGADDRDVFSKADNFTLVDEARSMNIYPFFQALDSNDGPEGRIYGERVLMFGSNNYLGLTRHPEVIQAARDALDQFGSSMTGSRLLNGSTHLHEELEGRIAQFLHKEAALVFTTGYLANLGTISSLVSKRAVAVVDKADHASIYDGCKLADGDMIRFQHNDPARLEKVLKKVTEDRAAMLIIDGVYSMGGDIAPLDKFLDIAKRYGVRVFVDDAHAIGMIGEGGRGTGSHFGLEDEVDLVMGTFSKSLASIGGFVAGPAKVLEWVKHFGRSIMFSASLPPASTAAALASLTILEREPERVEHLAGLAKQWRDGLRGLGFNTGNSETAIVPVYLGDEYTTVMFWKALLEEGVYTNPVIYPATPMREAMLRTSCMATHTPEQIEQALEKFATVGRRQGHIS